MQSKKAIILGSAGQDGSYLKEFLTKKQYEVISLEINDTVQKSVESFSKFLQKEKPDEIYNLAAESSVLKSILNPYSASLSNAFLPITIFESVRLARPATKIFQASSCLIFGNPKKSPQNEKTPINPDPTNPYAIAKAYAHEMATFYRTKYNLFVSCAILYNHESPRHTIDFLAPQVVYAAACAKKGIKNGKKKNPFGKLIFENGKITLGQLDPRRDWGYARDYVDAMWRMLQLDKPEDFVIGTGKLSSVEDLCRQAFLSVGLDWKNYITIDERLSRPKEPVPYVADISKAKTLLQWQPTIPFKKWVEEMVKENL